MTYTEQVQNHLADCIRPVIARADVFASELGIAPSTLCTQLRREGSTWQALLAAEIERRIYAMRCNGFSEREISVELGYAKFSNYRRGLENMANKRRAAA
ncbi:MAG: hypothetical protein AAGI72_15305 [Pseudomonadota bacterium]